MSSEIPENVKKDIKEFLEAPHWEDVSDRITEQAKKYLRWLLESDDIGAENRLYWSFDDAMDCFYAYVRVNGFEPEDWMPEEAIQRVFWGDN